MDKNHQSKAHASKKPLSLAPTTATTRASAARTQAVFSHRVARGLHRASSLGVLITGLTSQQAASLPQLRTIFRNPIWFVEETQQLIRGGGNSGKAVALYSPGSALRAVCAFIGESILLLVKAPQKTVNATAVTMCMQRWKRPVSTTAYTAALCWLTLGVSTAKQCRQ